jgi:hypothetical protein
LSYNEVERERQREREKGEANSLIAQRKRERDSIVSFMLVFEKHLSIAVPM